MGVGAAIGAVVALQVGSGVFQGVQAKKAGEAQKKQLDAQASLTLSESKREAGRLRLQHKIENAGLKLQFLQQGVGLAGSPENILASSMNLQDEEARAIISSGEAKSQFLSLQGQNARSQGRAALISGVVSGIAAGGSTAIMAKAGGLLDKPSIKAPAGATGRGGIIGSKQPGTDLIRP